MTEAVKPERFRITPAQRMSPLWLDLSAHLRERLASLRVQNDNVNLTPEKTAVLRGRIAELNSILGLSEDRPRIDAPPG